MLFTLYPIYLHIVGPTFGPTHPYNPVRTSYMYPLFAQKASGRVLTSCYLPSDELCHEQEKFKAISEELDQTFAEMSGY